MPDAALSERVPQDATLGTAPNPSHSTRIRFSTTCHARFPSASRSHTTKRPLKAPAHRHHPFLRTSHNTLLRAPHHTILRQWAPQHATMHRRDARGSAGHVCRPAEESGRRWHEVAWSWTGARARTLWHAESLTRLHVRGWGALLAWVRLRGGLLEDVWDVGEAWWVAQVRVEAWWGWWG